MALARGTIVLTIECDPIGVFIATSDELPQFVAAHHDRDELIHALPAALEQELRNAGRSDDVVLIFIGRGHKPCTPRRFGESGGTDRESVKALLFDRGQITKDYLGQAAEAAEAYAT